MSTRLYFTRTGAARLLQEKKDLVAKLAEIQGQKGEAAEVGGNQWHDNFSFEQLSREEDIINTQIREVNDRIRNMVTVEDKPEDMEFLRIGHLAVFDVGGEKKTVLIGGHGDSEPNSDPPIVSYLAPLALPFIGQEEGFVAKVKIGGTLKEVTLERIKEA